MTTADTDSQAPPKSRGVMVTPGATLKVVNLTISVGDDGTVSGSASLQVSLNMCPTWLTIAARHIRDAVAAQNRLRLCHEAGDEAGLGTALLDQANAGMQAIVASCAAFDAFYASITDRLPVDAATADAWKKNGTGRYKRIAEVLRRTFKMSNESAKLTRDAMKQNFQYRAWAVHPPAAGREPVFYPEIERAVEWRLFAFRVHNAQAIAGQTLSMIAQISRLPRRQQPDTLAVYLEANSKQLLGLIAEWEGQFGTVLPPDFPRGPTPHAESSQAT